MHDEDRHVHTRIRPLYELRRIAAGTTSRGTHNSDRQVSPYDSQALRHAQVRAELSCTCAIQMLQRCFSAPHTAATST